MSNLGDRRPWEAARHDVRHELPSAGQYGQPVLPRGRVPECAVTVLVDGDDRAAQSPELQGELLLELRDFAHVEDDGAALCATPESVIPVMAGRAEQFVGMPEDVAAATWALGQDVLERLRG